MQNETPDPVLMAALREMCANGEARRIRLAARLSQADIATHCGVAVNTVSRWELNLHRPHGPGALRYAALLDLLAGRATR